MTVQTQLPVPYEYRPGHTPVFSPQAQGAFLDNLSINGNVRNACKVARVSPQTAYRARRQSPALAQLWDAALLSARDRAEEVLADRAMKGTEESVFYHGEEVATRIRYDSRLLLAHLARLDRLAERAEVSAALTQMDDAVDALKRGEELPENLALDSVPSVPSCREPSSSSAAVGQTITSSSGHRPQVAEGGRPHKDAVGHEQRLSAMEAARPEDALKPHQLGSSIEETGAIEALQLDAFEVGLPEWWLITSEEALEAALTHALKQRSGRAEDAQLAVYGGEGVSCAPEREGDDDTHWHDDGGDRADAGPADDADGLRAEQPGGGPRERDRQV
ncbi:hypothetical protein BPTFM16_01234 [Altererythrobacter insulae]|nr:hypothetical protein BPTFM16_01234 [Altererythrobacter insulae]